VVDLDLESFFDRVDHSRLLHRLRRHVPDAAVLRLINAFLKAGVWMQGKREPSVQGYRKAGRCRLCWPTWCLTNWIGNLTGAPIALRVMLTTAILQWPVNERGSG